MNVPFTGLFSDLKSQFGVLEQNDFNINQLQLKLEAVEYEFQLLYEEQLSFKEKELSYKSIIEELNAQIEFISTNFLTK